MKNIILITITVFCLSIILYPTQIISNNGGSPGGKTGSPTDQATCQACHYAGLGSGGIITTNIPSSGYIPGNTYTITASVTDNSSSKFGFEITSEEDNFGSAKKGTFLITNAVETKHANNNTAVTHKAAGTSAQSNTKSWSMDWVAPGFASSTGGVVFYGSFMATNGDGTNMGDIYHSTTLTVSEGTGTSINESINNISLYIENNYLQIKNYKQINNILIHDIQGKVVYESFVKKEKIDLNSLNPGIYIVNAIDDQKNRFTQKIMLD
ncbi:MAG: choice-of-anchor V domain-containing protein [Bacteroidota bacterium]|nr:choice-of-anchor V domain-containing protein [Bacteroidota bacterium]